MQGLGYKEIAQYVRGEIGFEEAVELLKKNTRRFAKRQYTWFRSDERISWVDVDGRTATEVSEKLKELLLSMNRTQMNLQDTFLNQVRKDSIPVTIYLVSGVQLKGMVRGFDSFTVILETPGKSSQLVYKHAMASVVPARHVSLVPREDRGQRVATAAKAPHRRPRPKHRSKHGLRFVKMHGAGNDFVIIDGEKEAVADEYLPSLARSMCDRQLGIGGDGIILVLPSRLANFKMRMFNPDGSEAEMCGNGIRCFAKYIYDRKMHQDVVMTVETLGGIKTLKLNSVGGKVRTVRVDMGEPKLHALGDPNEGQQHQGHRRAAQGRRQEV